ncbi:unnamed protein product, partial [Dovyalis caffra]
MHDEFAGNSNGWKTIGRKGGGLNQPLIDRGVTAMPVRRVIPSKVECNYRQGRMAIVDSKRVEVHYVTLRRVGETRRAFDAVASHISPYRLERLVENPDPIEVVVEELVLPNAHGATTRASRGNGQTRAFMRVTTRSGGVKTRGGSRRVPTTVAL